MRKILMLSFVAALAIVGCKKQEATISRVVTVSYPTITIKGQQFYSFPVGGGPLPSANTIQATAYDSFYKQSLTPVVDASRLTNVAPGLYIATVSARNSYGFTGYGYVYVAITNITDSMNLGGKYVRTANNDTVNITKLSRGLYRTDNVGGVLKSNPAFIIPGYFVQTTDTTLDMPLQPSAQGNFSGGSGAIDLTPGDTTIMYSIQNNGNFGTQIRTFKKI